MHLSLLQYDTLCLLSTDSVHAKGVSFAVSKGLVA